MLAGRLSDKEGLYGTDGKPWFGDRPAILPDGTFGTDIEKHQLSREDTLRALAYGIESPLNVGAHFNDAPLPRWDDNQISDPFFKSSYPDAANLPVGEDEDLQHNHRVAFGPKQLGEDQIIWGRGPTGYIDRQWGRRQLGRQAGNNDRYIEQAKDKVNGWTRYIRTEENAKAVDNRVSAAKNLGLEDKAEKQSGLGQVQREPQRRMLNRHMSSSLVRVSEDEQK